MIALSALSARNLFNRALQAHAAKPSTNGFTNSLVEMQLPLAA
jgi:hypothetical protein